MKARDGRPFLIEPVLEPDPGRKPLPNSVLSDNVRLGVGLIILLMIFLIAQRLPELRERRPPVETVELPAYRSFYLPAGDGTRLAVDLWLPTQLPANRRLGTVVRMTRTWRSAADGAQPADAAAAVEAGLAMAVIDARGTGASFGARDGFTDRHDLADFRALVDWVVAQRWSSGRVVAVGSDFDGRLAEALAASGHPAVRAAVVRFAELDGRRELLRPGGLANLAYRTARTAYEQSWDQADGAGPRLVADDTDGALLAAARAERAANRYREPSDLFGAWLDPKVLLAGVERATIPVYVWAGWHDGATARGALARFAARRSPVQVVIGPWVAGRETLDPLTGLPPTGPISMAEQIRAAGEFAGQMLAEAPAPIEGYVQYYVLGEGRWETTDRWPPRRIYDVDWFAADAGRLSREAPSREDDADRRTLVPGWTTGPINRWTARADGKPPRQPKPGPAEARLSYTSAKLEAPSTLVGSPLLTLEFASDATAPSVFAYLELLDPTGRVVTLTEGGLDTRLRAAAPGEPPYPVTGPFRAVDAAGAAPLTPGEPVTVELALEPVAVRIPAGWRLRLSLASADVGVFEPTTAGPLRLTVFRERRRATRITLPELR